MEQSLNYQPGLPEPAAGRSSGIKRYLTLLLRSRTATFGFIVIVALLLIAVFQSQIATHDPTAQGIRVRLTPPAWMEGGDPQYLLGDRPTRPVIFSAV